MREREIDVCRVAANGLIVVLHAWGAASQYDPGGSVEYGVWKFLGVNSVIGLYALFLVSGYLMFRGRAGTHDPAGSCNDLCTLSWREKIGRRLKRLVVPYLCWNLVFVAFYLCVGGLFPRVGARVEGFGLTTFAGALSKIIHPFVQPIDVPVWYMRTVFIYALLAPLMGLALRSRVGRWAGLAVVGGYYVAVSELGLLPGLLGYPAYSLLLFYVGGMLATGSRPLCAWFVSPWWIAGALAGFALDAVGWGSIDARMILKVGAFFWLIGMVKGEVPASLMKLSFFVYCGHFLFCSPFVHAVGPYLGALPSGRVSLLMFLFLVPGLALTIGVYELARRWVRRAVRAFDGSM